MNQRIDSPQAGYWRVEKIHPEPGDDRCIMLYGQDEEIVGPMTAELAEAWMQHFDGQPKPAAAAKAATVEAPVPGTRSRKLSRRRRPAGSTVAQEVAPASPPETAVR